MSNVETDLNTMRTQLENARRSLASKEGELSRLREEQADAERALKDAGVESVEEAEAEIARLTTAEELARTEAAALLMQAQAILDGTVVTTDVQDAPVVGTSGSISSLDDGDDL